MSYRCQNCQTELPSGPDSLEKPVQCPSCGVEFDTNFLGQIKRNVGIHPALAKRYGQIEKTVVSEATTVMQPTSRFLSRKRSRPLFKKKSIGLEGDETKPRIPGYELKQCIGKGAMGSVYLALHLISGREAAVKVLASELSHRRDLVARFEREAAALRAFRHPNVVAIFDSGSFGDTHYYGMEFIDGINLRRLIRKGKLDVFKSIRYMRMILRGLKAAHDRGVIHRDLKPENVLVEKLNNEEERVVLVDFGLAGILNESADPHPNLTRSKVTMGTVNYMAPEQHTDAKRVDFRSDIYACGVILYECLTGDLPLGRFLLPSERGIRVPESVDVCLTKALARPLNERYQTVAEFDGDLSQIEEELKSFLPARFLPKKNVQSVITKLNTEVDIKSSPVDSANVSLEENRSIFDVAKTIYKTKFASVPTWVKKPNMAYGFLALLVGLVVGIIISKQTPLEVVVSADGALPIFASTTFKAPGPRFVLDSTSVEVADMSTLKVQKKGGYIKYKSASPVWNYNDSQITYLATQGNAAHFRRDMSLVVSPVNVPLTSSEIKGSLSFRKISLPVTPAKTHHLARGLLGATPEIAAGGIFYVNKQVSRAIGTVLFVDGTCGVAEFKKKDSFLEFVQYEKGKCRQSFVDTSVDLGLKCDLNSGKCVGLVSNTAISTIDVEDTEEDDWQIALGCRNINCAFKLGGKS